MQMGIVDISTLVFEAKVCFNQYCHSQEARTALTGIDIQSGTKKEENGWNVETAYRGGR